jgi:hypothetical protein
LIVGGKAATQPEPIKAWWERVGQPILSKHYSDRQKERDRRQATDKAALLDDVSGVLHHTEDEVIIDNIEALMLQGAATRIVQKFGPFYALQIVRWLAFLISDLADIGAYKERITPLFGLGEPFKFFRLEDSYLRQRRRWSIYPR